ncbi:type 1 fimbrial protein [Klebsiella aerogenes]|nr:type 1 fimbrial protein [Klebsiella aerogenes]HEO1675229.1 type 1 fimbrial protein [Klebsiella aerogenes]
MFRPFLFVLLALSGADPRLADAADDNIHFTGALVAEPCVIPSGEENIPLEFGTIIDKYLYENQRTGNEPFTIHLTECDPAIASTLSVIFSGTPSPSLPGLLALDGGSTASGVAIGLNDMNGDALPLEQAPPVVELAKGENVLTFSAYVQGEPEAIANRSIGRGEFTATATFTLKYE